MVQLVVGVASSFVACGTTSLSCGGCGILCSLCLLKPSVCGGYVIIPLHSSRIRSDDVRLVVLGSQVVFLHISLASCTLGI